MSDKQYINRLSILNEDPRSGMLFAQFCVAFARANYEQFMKFMEETGKSVFPPTALLDDFAPAYSLLEYMQELYGEHELMVDLARRFMDQN